MPNETDANAITSHEQDGRVLSGVGVSADRLAETMERHAPEEPAAPAVDADQAAPPAAPEQPVSRGRQRFAELARERDEARAEAAAAREREAAAARERDEVRSRFESRAPEPVASAAPVERQPTRPEPTENDIGAKEDGGKYPTYAAFARDLAKWVVEQHEAERSDTVESRVRDVLAREREHGELTTVIESARERGRKAYPDFDALMDGPAGKRALAMDYKESMERLKLIARHPQSEHIQYAILKDAALAEKLRDSSALEFGVAIAGLVPAARAAAPAWTPPPAPYATVGGSTATTSKPSAELAKGFDFDKSGYREKRAAERGVKAKRF